MITSDKLSAIRLIVSDIDGTLVQKENRIRADIKQKILALRRRGIFFTLATGRLPYETDHLLLDLPKDIPYVSSNGAMIKKNQSVIWEKSFSMRPLQGLVEKYDSLGVSVFFSVDDLERPYRTTTWVKQNIAMFPGLDQPVGTEIWDRNIHRAFFFHPDGLHLPACYQDLQAFEDQYDFCFQDAHSIQIAPPRCTKATGIQRLADFLDLPASAILCIGDSGNDISMIQYAGIGVAVANASAELKRASDFVTEGSASDGVLEVLDLLLKTTQNFS